MFSGDDYTGQKNSIYSYKKRPLQNHISLYFFVYFRPYLTSGKREILADYALPIAVLFVSFFGLEIQKALTQLGLSAG